jgi:hypothetical protein
MPYVHALLDSRVVRQRGKVCRRIVVVGVEMEGEMQAREVELTLLSSFASLLDAKLAIFGDK